MSSILTDVRYSLRTLRSTPGFTAVVVAVLAIGIGANTAMFTAVDAAFLRPLPFAEPDRLVEINEGPPDAGYMPVAYPNYLDWERQQDVFESMAIAGGFPETLLNNGPAERVRVGYVSSGLLSVYRIRPIIGRDLTPADDKPGSEHVALLTHTFWQTRFGGDPNVLGRKLTSDATVYTIVGVLPPFPWHIRDVQFLAAIGPAADKLGMTMRENHNNVVVIARLKPGVTLERARTQIRAIARRLELQYPGSNGGITAHTTPLRDYVGGSVQHSVLLLFGSVTVLLLIACSNVAGLLLARSAVRRREIAIRAALGASPGRLIRTLLTESVLLGLAGAVGGLWIAAFSVSALTRLFPAAEALGGLTVDVRVLLFSMAVAVVTGILFGLAPALHLARPDVIAAMKGAGRTVTGGALRLRVRKVLVMSQVALCAVLLVGAGLLARSLMQLSNVNPGFRPQQLLTLQIEPPNDPNADAGGGGRMFTELTERIATLPGVQAAGAITNLPFAGPDSSANFYRDDQPVPEPGKVPDAMQAGATPSYFQAMGIPLLRGRLFAASDGQVPPMKRNMKSMLAYFRGGDFKVVINEAMAKQFWPNEDPIGRRFRFGPPSFQGPALTIIGVVGNARQRTLEQPANPQFYFSTLQYPFPPVHVVVRTTGDPTALAATIRGMVAERDKYAVVSRVTTMEAVIADTLTGRRNNVMLLIAFSAVALLLAGLGLYGTMAYMVAQRTPEIGVRMALGAAQSEIRRMVVGEGAALAGAGLVIGIAAALALARLVSSMLYGVTTMDALTYGAAVAVLGLITLAASYLPASRASRVEPMEALRFE